MNFIPPLYLSLILMQCAFSQSNETRSTQIVRDKPEPSVGQQRKLDDQVEANTATEKKERRNPFAAAKSVTNQNTRAIREALNKTKIMGVISTSNGKTMAVLKPSDNGRPIFVKPGSFFSIELKGDEWTSIVVNSISQFEVSVTPEGTDEKISIR